MLGPPTESTPYWRYRIDVGTADILWNITHGHTAKRSLVVAESKIVTALRPGLHWM
ncbi:hypothetical protein FRB99_008295 [Tulasnella sp. 403]|nr:hypothetical protein FRB99_008295 [Tulasnella sp. 403]